MSSGTSVSLPPAAAGQRSLCRDGHGRGARGLSEGPRREKILLSAAWLLRAVFPDAAFTPAEVLFLLVPSSVTASADPGKAVAGVLRRPCVSLEFTAADGSVPPGVR